MADDSEGEPEAAHHQWSVPPHAQPAAQQASARSEQAFMVPLAGASQQGAWAGYQTGHMRVDDKAHDCMHEAAPRQWSVPF